MCVELMYSETLFIQTPKIQKIQSTKQHSRSKSIKAVNSMQMVNYK